jgi:glutamate N-acetyltransferase/amino-acid N-acetyltransferase
MTEIRTPGPLSQAPPLDLETHLRVVAGHVATPRGFYAAGVHCGLKAGRPDLALVVSDRLAAAAGVFTTNRVQAAPVRYSRRALESGTARAIVVNSGNANACTGERGERDARAMAEGTARALGIAPEHVLVASTGVIGVPLPIDKIEAGIAAAAGSVLGQRDDVQRRDQGGVEAAVAILTTDTRTKTLALRVELPGGPVTIGGMAKGAGMIHPDMATTLAFLTTDAAIEAPLLRALLRDATERSFNCITVDGDTSTNDCLLVMANGAAEVPVADDEAVDRFAAAQRAACLELAKMVVRDGEGATKLLSIRVTGARSDAEAKQAAMAVATSLLVKTAVHGGEPNWGRILSAVGRSGAQMREEKTRIFLGELEIVSGGVGALADLTPVAAALARPEIELAIELGLGPGTAKVYTCDLSAEYVRINGSYIS